MSILQWGGICNHGSSQSIDYVFLFPFLYSTRTHVHTRTQYWTQMGDSPTKTTGHLQQRPRPRGCTSGLPRAHQRDASPDGPGVGRRRGLWQQHTKTERRREGGREGEMDWWRRKGKWHRKGKRKRDEREMEKRKGKRGNVMWGLLFNIKKF